MLKLKSKLLAAAAALFCSGFAIAQDSGALIDLLVKKGIVNDQEAEELRADLTKDFASTSAGKLNLSAAMSELRIAGDVRVRFESRTGVLPNGDASERDRYRYRFRAGLTGKMANNWSWGFRLETSNGSRSSNVTMADDGGPYGKVSDTVNIGQIWAQWTPNPNFTLTVGRMANPLVSTLMVWDADINPEGLAEQFKHRDGKVEYSATLAQFLYSAASTQNAFGSGATPGAKTDDLYLLAWQGGIKYYTGEGTASFFQINPTIYNYAQRNNFNPVAFRGNFTPANGAGINDLTVLDIPIEYDWVMNGTPVRLFGDFAINFDASDRATKYGRPDLSNQDKAWQVGIQYGKAVNKGEWDVRAGYQSTAAFALDPNLVDSDIFDSRTNMQGFVVNGNYALGAATTFTLTLAPDARRVNSTISSPGSGDLGANNALNKYWLLMADLVLKF
jgi:hypothetical protein